MGKSAIQRLVVVDWKAMMTMSENREYQRPWRAYAAQHLWAAETSTSPKPVSMPSGVKESLNSKGKNNELVL